MVRRAQFEGMVLRRAGGWVEPPGGRAPGDDLLLLVEPSAGPSDPENPSLRLDVSGWSGGRRARSFSATAYLALGDTIVLPGAWLPVADVDSIEIDVRYDFAVVSDGPGGLYRLSTLLEQRLRWVVPGGS